HRSPTPVPPSFPTRRSSDLAHLGELRVTLDDDGSGDSTPLQRLMAAIRGSHPSITGLLNDLHEAVRAAGDGAGVYGHTGRSGAEIGEHTSELQSLAYLVCRL